MLGLTAGHDGAPGLPPALIADLAGGAYPAMMNILLALRQRDSTGRGCHLDIAMADHLFPLMYWGLGNGFSSGHWPTPGSDLVTGASPRYQVYQTLDGQYLACAPLEEKFWIQFLDCIGAPELRDDATDPKATVKAIAAIIATRVRADWLVQFEGRDVCVAPVRSLEEAVKHPHFQHRGLFSAKLDDGSGRQIPALPVPIDCQFRGDALTQGYPSLGEDQQLLESP
jgi:crotonobetainyl-CoA:carnitine CoA-transferase CaiB-like acyl-CoA transferase